MLRLRCEWCGQLILKASRSAYFADDPKKRWVPIHYIGECIENYVMFHQKAHGREVIQRGWPEFKLDMDDGSDEDYAFILPSQDTED